jgi:hypothetical protein
MFGGEYMSERAVFPYSQLNIATLPATVVER